MGQGILLLAAALAPCIWRGQWNGRLGFWAGWGALAIAALCGIAGARALGRNLTPFPKPDPAARFVQSGIYSLMRHPLYTAVILATLGWGLVWGCVPGLGLGLALIPFFDAKARREERWLRLQFPEYGDYEGRVSRFIPWVY
jgi:protein-S-isoprenylcysteine O-methyltransferase Ste14